MLDGGSLYWVIRGVILVRQRIIDLRPDTKDDGIACCGIVLDPVLVATRAHRRGARSKAGAILPADDAPADLRVVGEDEGDMPRAMRADLRELRLIDF